MSLQVDGTPVGNLINFAIGAGIGEMSAQYNGLRPGTGVGMYAISEGLESVIKPVMQQMAPEGQKIIGSLGWNVLAAVALAYPVAKIMNYMGREDVTTRKVLWTNATPVLFIGTVLASTAVLLGITGTAVNVIRG